MPFKALSFFILFILCGHACIFAAPKTFIITSDSGFKLTDQEKEKHNKIIEKELKINLDTDSFLINDVKVKPREIIIETVSGDMIIDQVPHRGSIVISPNGELQLLAEEVPDAIEKDQDHFAAGKNEVQLPKPESVVSSISKKPSHVRVLLDEQPLGQADYRFFNSKGFIVGQSRKDPNKQHTAEPELHVTSKRGVLYANGNRFSGDKMIIAPREGHIEFGGNTYQGIFNIQIASSEPEKSNSKKTRNNNAKKQVLLINSIDVEDYIFSVVRSESWPNWPLEVNKVFAIACRSYVIAMAMRAKKTALPYHIRNTNKHQRYDGLHSCPIIARAVEETRGVFLAYKDVPIIAMFDSCCGGVIPAHVAHMNFADAPYLARDYACTHCERCKIYSWETSIAMTEFENLLHGKKKKVGKVRSVKVAKKDKAGLVQEVAVRDAKKTVRLSGKEMYSMIKGVKSYCYSVSKNSDTVHIEGRGYGHHVGLCQWGAREMVRDGWDYKSILEFYYPGTTFMKLS